MSDEDYKDYKPYSIDERYEATRYQGASQISHVPKERIRFSARNFFAVSAIYRMFFLVFALTGILASALSKSTEDNGLFSSYAALRLAYLVLTCVAFFIQFIILILDLINAFNARPLNKLPITPIILIIDCIMFFGILICSIFMFMKAKDMATDFKTSLQGPIYAYFYFKTDAFYVCAIVGYLMSMLYVEEIVYLCFQLLAHFLEKRKSKKRLPNNYGY